jgi:hypothetical protein
MSSGAIERDDNFFAKSTAFLDSRGMRRCALLRASAWVFRSAAFIREQTDEDFNLLCRGDVGCSAAGDARSRRECSRLVRELGL